jgi:hypothetical protein
MAITIALFVRGQIVNRHSIVLVAFDGRTVPVRIRMSHGGDPNPFDAFSLSTKSLTRRSRLRNRQISAKFNEYSSSSLGSGKTREGFLERTVNIGGRQRNIDLIRLSNDRIAIFEAMNTLMPAAALKSMQWPKSRND